MRCQDGPPGGSGFHQAYRERCRDVDGDLVASRCHQQAGAVEATVSQPLAHVNKITRDQRSNVGIGASGALAFVFTDLGTNLAGQRDIKIREVLQKNLAYARLMCRIGIGMQQSHCDAFDGLSLNALDQCIDGRLIQGL